MTPFDIRCWELIARPDLVRLPGLLVDLIKAHKFLLRDGVSETMADFADQLIANKTFVLPFDPIILEFRSDACTERVVFLATRTPEDNIMVIPFLRPPTGRWSGGFDYYVVLDLKKCYWHPSPKYYATLDPIWRGKERQVADVFAGTIALLTSNSCDVSAQITVPMKIQKNREKSGKPPLFDYRIVKLSPSKSIHGNDFGGTHRSPALHWRRGHIRHLGSRLVPISPCLVGDVLNGFIRKDYDASALNRRQDRGNINQTERLRGSSVTDTLPAADPPDKILAVERQPSSS